MDAVSLIVGALAAGALAGTQGTATAAVNDAYTGLKDLIRRRFAGRASTEASLREHEHNSQAWESVLTRELQVVRAGDDADIVKAAQHLMALIDPVGTRVAKYSVDLRGAQGVQLGDSNLQWNTFSAPPKSDS